MAEGRPGPRQYRSSAPDAPRSFPVHDYGQYVAPTYDSPFDQPAPGRFEPPPDAAPRHAAATAATRVLTRRNALVGTALMTAGAGTTYLMRNVGRHGAPAPVADVPGVSLPEIPSELPATLPRRLPGTGQRPKAPRPGSTAPGSRRPSLSTNAHAPAGIGSGADGSGLAGVDAMRAALDPELLLRRLSYGPTAAMRAFVSAHGAGAWLSAQLAPSRLADRAAPRSAGCSRGWPGRSTRCTARSRTGTGGR